MNSHLELKGCLSLCCLRERFLREWQCKLVAQVNDRVGVRAFDKPSLIPADWLTNNHYGYTSILYYNFYIIELRSLKAALDLALKEEEWGPSLTRDVKDNELMKEED